MTKLKTIAELGGVELLKIVVMPCNAGGRSKTNWLGEVCVYTQKTQQIADIIAHDDNDEADWTNLEDSDKRPMKRVEVLATARALIGPYLAARADMLVVIVSAKLAAEQVHPEHATAQHT